MHPEIALAHNLLDFIHSSPTAFHVVESVKKQLIASGFQYLDIQKQWTTLPKHNYFNIYNDTAIFAFKMGSFNPQDEGIRIIAAHTDSPGLKLKPNPQMWVENRYLKLNVEVYGSPIWSSWFDRPLSIAGRLILKGLSPFQPQIKLVHFEQPLMQIPNLAIHLNRQVNEGVALNAQKDLLPLLSAVEKELQGDMLMDLLQSKVDFKSEDLLDFDLFVVPAQKGVLLGALQELISSPRLDDLAMAHAGLQAFMHSPDDGAMKMLCLFDNEEVGSQTKQGAGSPILKNIITRIFEQHGKSQEELMRTIYNSFMVSADMAHALHPNQTEKHDPVLHPVLNGGPVIKYHANQKYTTDAVTASIFEQICKKADVPVQKFANRSDMVGGSTLGNVLTSQLEIPSVDVGSPMLAMHSAHELAGVQDHWWMTKALKGFYNE